MDLFAVFGLASATFILAVIPGPGVFAVTTRSISAGLPSALVMSLGVLLGDILYILLTVYGLSVIATSLYGLFTVIRYAGSAYLIWLGISLFRTRIDFAGTPDLNGHVSHTPVPLTIRSCLSSLLTGFSITLGNPKVIFFYLGFLPTFMDLTDLTHVDVLIVCCTSFSVSICVLSTYAYLADRSRRFFSSAKAKVRLNRTAGCVLAATGIALAADN